MEKPEKKFHNMSVEERIKTLENEGIDKEALKKLKDNILSIERANLIVENVIGRISLPLGVLRNLKLNGKFYNVLMAIEEPSVIAAANKAAKLTLNHGFVGEVKDNQMIGEIQIVNYDKSKLKHIEELMEELEKEGESLSEDMKRYGGGWRGITYKELKGERKNHLVFYFYVDVADAMGANTINTIAENLSPLIEEKLSGISRLKIISNLSTRRIVKVKALWKKENIGKDASKKGLKYDDVVEGILDAYELAKIDLYRLATNNKGIMNGIDAVALAYGQDWRAIEAGAHTYSAMNNFSPLASYKEGEEGIVGEIELPIAVGTVGGAINSLPHAKEALKITKPSSSKELAMIMASVGLANNFSAIYAMVTEGIQRGHMKLHAKNIAILAGAKDEEVEIVAKKLNELNSYSLEKAKEILSSIRDKDEGN